MNDLLSQLETVFRNVFDQDLVLSEDMTADDVDGWDSMAHINLIIAIERQFGLKFATAEISGLKQKGQSIGSMLRLIAAKKGAVAPKDLR